VDRSVKQRGAPLRWAFSAARHVCALGRLACAIRRTHSQIVHVHTCSFFSFHRSVLDIVLARLLGCRTCIHIHGGRFAEFCAGSGHAGRWIIRRGCELADSVIVLAPYWAGQLRPFLGRARLYAVPNGVALPKTMPRRPGGGGRTCRFVYLGALCANKGLEELLAAAAKVRAAGVTFELVVAGPVKPPSQHWEESAGRLGLEECVKFVGPVTGARKAELLKTTDCLMLPSRREGLPLVLLEAAAAGLPVIATSVGAIPEVLNPPLAGSSFRTAEESIAPMVPPGDSEALAREMIRLAGDTRLRETIARRLHARVRAEYSLDRMADHLTAIYQHMLAVPVAAGGPPAEMAEMAPPDGAAADAAPVGSSREPLPASGTVRGPRRRQIAKSRGRPNPELQVQTK
jgi:glycosyltransferase involved in cell wall biosynthesis